MATADFPGIRWRGHWVAADVPEFVIDLTSVGSDLPPAEFSRAQFRRALDVEDVPPRVPLRLPADSVLFLILAVVNQGLWLFWAILVPDAGTMIFATVTGIITVFNLIWWSLRTLGLRPSLAAGHRSYQAMDNRHAMKALLRP